MSIISFIENLISKIASLFNGLPSYIKEAAKIAVTVTEAIKNFDDANPEVVDIITTIIPGDVDDKIAKWVRIQLPVILTSLRLVNTPKATADPQTIVLASLNSISQLQGNIKNAFLHDLAALLAQEVAKAKNHEVKWTDAVLIVEWYYQHKFKSLNQ